MHVMEFGRFLWSHKVATTTCITLLCLCLGCWLFCHFYPCMYLTAGDILFLIECKVRESKWWGLVQRYTYGSHRGMNKMSYIERGNNIRRGGVPGLTLEDFQQLVIGRWECAQESKWFIREKEERVLRVSGHKSKWSQLMCQKFLRGLLWWVLKISIDTT